MYRYEDIFLRVPEQPDWTAAGHNGQEKTRKTGLQSLNDIVEDIASQKGSTQLLKKALRETQTLRTGTQGRGQHFQIFAPP